MIDFGPRGPCVSVLPTKESGKSYIFAAVRLGSELVCTAILRNVLCIQAESV